MICEDCGETNKPGTQFCLFCGAYLGWQTEPDQPTANEVTQPIAPQHPAPAPARSAPPAQNPSAQNHPAQNQPAQNQPAPAQAVQAAPSRTQPGAQRPPAQAAGHPAQQAPVQDLTATAVADPVVPVCPTCGRTVSGGRRFCAHCGHQFVLPGTAGAPAVRPATKRDTWWSRLWDNKDRVSRRAFRRSLPPMYRWRRVLVILLSLGLIGGGLTFLHHSPKSFVMARYYDIRKSLVPIQPVSVRTIPELGSAGDTDPSALVDNRKSAWLMPWTDQTKGSPCGSTPTTTVVELWFDAERVRRVDIYPGLSADNPTRLLQFRPKEIWIAYGDQCVSKTLDETERQNIPLDTKVKVESIRIGVVSAFAPTQTPAQNVLGFTEIRLERRPHS